MEHATSVEHIAAKLTGGAGGLLADLRAPLCEEFLEVWKAEVEAK